MFGELSNEESLEILSENIYGRIGCHGSGKTYVVPISYAFKNNTLYFHTKEGLKIRLMRENPSVCFQTDVLGDPSNWRSVIVQGEFRELAGKERDEALEVLLDREVPAIFSSTLKLTTDWPFTSDKSKSQIGGIVFSIDIREVSGRYEKAEPVFNKR